MRVALKIAYDGRAFFGHQRQPDRRTVEGECIAALNAAKVIRDVPSAFFRSASRTDRGVSAVGNVIAFDTTWPPQAVVGAFDDKARDVWAWAAAEVPETFHPRLALERWYRYSLPGDLPKEALVQAASEFEGTHDFRSYTSDPPPGPITIRSVSVVRDDGLLLIDVRARSFRRGMVRRIVAGMVAFALREITLPDLRASLAGGKLDFGAVRPEPLVLMDVLYDFPFRVILKPKVVAEWRQRERDLRLRLRFLREFGLAAQIPVAL